MDLSCNSVAIVMVAWFIIGFYNAEARNCIKAFFQAAEALRNPGRTFSVRCDCVIEKMASDCYLIGGKWIQAITYVDQKNLRSSVLTF